MEKCDNFTQVPMCNQIFVNPEKSFMINSHVVFKGNGNILFVEDGVYLHNSIITFHNDNSVVYLSKNWYKYFLNLSVFYNNCIYLGKDCYYNGIINILAGENQNILIGNDSLFSFGIYIKTVDGHMVFETKNMHRINLSGSILIGDHVWIGQQVVLLKGTVIGSGAILGACSVVSNKRIASNTAWAGNPARRIRSEVFFTKELTQAWTMEQTESMKIDTTTDWIYHGDGFTKDMRTIDNELKTVKDTSKKLYIIQERIVIEQSKNRFYIGNE